jgi:hypothetical protein
MKDYYKQQRRMDVLHDILVFTGIAFGIFILICRIILIAVG